MIRQRSGRGPTGIIFSLIFIGLILLFTFYSMQAIYSILTYIFPFLIIAAAIINYKVIFDYVNMVVDKLKNNFFSGLIYVIGSIVFYPVLAGFLFYKALSSSKSKERQKERGTLRSKRQNKKKKSKAKQESGEYINFEEMDDSPLDFDEMKRQKKSLEELFEKRNSEQK